MAKVKENAPAASSANPRFHMPDLETVLNNRADKFAILNYSRDRPSNYNYYVDIYNYKSIQTYGNYKTRFVRVFNKKVHKKGYVVSIMYTSMH